MYKYNNTDNNIYKDMQLKNCISNCAIYLHTVYGLLQSNIIKHKLRNNRKSSIKLNEHLSSTVKHGI